MNIGTLVRFREDVPQYGANAGIIFRVTSEPLRDNTTAPAHPYVWLEVADDSSLTRSAYVDALEEVVSQQVIAELGVVLADLADLGWEDPNYSDTEDES